MIGAGPTKAVTGPAVVGGSDHGVAGITRWRRNDRNERNRHAGRSGFTRRRSRRTAHAFGRRMQRVPADLRNLERGIVRRHLSFTSPSIQPRPLWSLSSRGPRERHQLHADADAEEGPRPSSLERRRRAGLRCISEHGIETTALAIGIGADARQHDTVGRWRPRSGLVCQLDLGRDQHVSCGQHARRLSPQSADCPSRNR